MLFKSAPINEVSVATVAVGHVLEMGFYVMVDNQGTKIANSHCVWTTVSTSYLAICARKTAVFVPTPH